MDILHLLIYFTLLNRFFAQQSVFHSHQPALFTFGFDCLYAYLIDDEQYRGTTSDVTYHLIPYCRRPAHDEELKFESSSISSSNVYNSVTFHDLYKSNVTSEQLLDWKAPIDLIEHYLAKSTDSMTVFYNCSLPWFGSRCQYRFANESASSFSDIVRLNFLTRLSISNGAPTGLDVNTCYPFLPKCFPNPTPICLDWRQICDGNVDCVSGDDEQYCQVLETNECPSDSYRCHYSGECVPLTFVQDERNNAECLDGTDETEIYTEASGSLGILCYTVPTFRCEEHTSRFQYSFQCGDGQYIPFHRIDSLPTTKCHNGRHIRFALHSDDVSFSILNEVLNQFYNSTLSSTMLILNQTLIDPHARYSIVPCPSPGSKCLSEWFFKALLPPIYSMFYFLYLPDRLFQDFYYVVEPDFICVRTEKCPGLIRHVTDIGLNSVGLACCSIGQLLNESLISTEKVDIALRELLNYCSTTANEQTCSHSSLFYCPLSKKCISKHRLIDGISDCYFNEDETYSACRFNDTQRFICTSEPNKCLSPIALFNGRKECRAGEDELNEHQRDVLNGYVPVSLVCDNKLHPLLQSANETDETNCELWPCSNPYTQCDGYQHCRNLSDEYNCPRMQYTISEDKCSKTILTGLFCKRILNLMEEKFNAEIIYTEHHDSLQNITNKNVTKCSAQPSCFTLYTICNFYSPPTSTINLCMTTDKLFCFWEHLYWISIFKTHVCPFSLASVDTKAQKESFFTPSHMGNFPSLSTTTMSKKNRSNIKSPTKISPPNRNLENWYCNRGILVWFNYNQSRKCLCSPSYFGDRCQWQNQRVSLTLQLEYRTDAFINIVFQLVIMLLDEQRRITSYHEQILYIPKQDCGRKYNIYLLYPTKPKNLSANYFIHVDVFNKITLTYLASWHLPIPFPFLPVNRIASRFFIPTASIISRPCPLVCGEHGQCVQYANGNRLYFCQCEQGYSGLSCDIKHQCACSSNSICLFSSICVCPVTKFGSRCYLNRSICRINPCQNHGDCVPVDDRIEFNKFICLCKQNFYGPVCEYQKNRIDIQFDNNKLNLMPFIYIHFVTASELQHHQQTTQLKKINIGQNFVTVYASYSFHLAFIELPDHTYFLIISREKSIDAEHVQTKVVMNHRCPNLTQLTNSTFANDLFLHRVKFYPLLCRQNQNLKCFHDEKHMCICDLDRFSNCFTFNTSSSHDCQGGNICEHGGQCFQDNSKCPVQSVCSCSECHYGTKCQFSTERFVFSLDSILTYHIQQNVSINQQLIIIKICIFITTVMLAFGLVNGVLSVTAFRMKGINQTGCNVYLLVSSWNSLALIIIFYAKFWHLLFAQMALITNKLYLTANCILSDMLMNVLITSNDWLYGCVAIERVFTVSKGVKFNQAKSKTFAKWISLCVYLMTILTRIQDPLHRRLIDDTDVDQQRTWCIVQYSTAMKMFNLFITFFHFFAPFSINFISTVVIIILIARSRSTTQRQTTFKNHLKQQFHKFKHHLIALSVVFILTLPRLVISMISGCMKSSTGPWLFLLGYFMSFIPSMMTFVVFILTAQKYKQQFRTTMQQTIRQIRTRFT
ncbi:unnamed protein product [Adineta ricciae]|uniref:Uncharacterized protein n=1 Tax=Adineta ricciae TaxID=249248 RepID=A0A815MRY9_ADIRI|nr:unnamed protein product [Adineta ricciae]CAF1600107.1 unnamed protein product [Adineta ricciae]